MKKGRPYARKRFGQHFLKDSNIVQRIVRSAELRECDHIVEIGPGRGALTTRLLDTGANLTVIEIDRDLANDLTKQYDKHDRFSLLNADVLKIDWSEFCSTDLKTKLVANLPYNISTPILFKLIANRHLFSVAIIMVQKEVAKRICHKGDTGNRKDYGVLSVIADSVFETELLFNVPPGSFVPAPKVDSSVIRLVPKNNMINDEQIFFDFVRRAFNQRRKLLVNHLRKNEEAIFQRLSEGDLSFLEGTRPDNLTPHQYLSLFYHHEIQ